MKDYDKNKESSDPKYLYINNLCGRAISQKLTVGVFEWVEETSQFNKDFTKSYNNDSNERYFLKVDVQYPKELHERDNDLPFLPERRKVGNVKKLVTIMHGKKEEVKHMQNLKKKQNLGLALKKVLWVTKFKQEARLKPYLVINTQLKNAKKYFGKDFFKLVNSSGFRKIMVNVKKLRESKLIWIIV